MQVYLLRHAKAVPGFPDGERPLAEKGRRHAAELGAFLKDFEGFSPREIWSSPLLRAKETESIFLEALGHSVKDRREVPELVPESDPECLVEQIGAAGQSLLIVGHNPNLETLASLLVSGERRRTRIRLKTCGMIAFEWQAYPSFGECGPCELRWMLDPRLL